MAKKIEMPSADNEKDIELESPQESLERLQKEDLGEEKDIELESSQEFLKRERLNKGYKSEADREAVKELLDSETGELVEPGDWEGPKKKKNDKVEEGVEDEEIEDARRELKERLDALKAKGKKPKVDASGEIDAVNKKEPAMEPAEKVIVEEEHEKSVHELTKKKNNFDPAKMSLDELDDRVNEMWKAMDKILKDAGAYNPTKEEKKKLQKFTKKGGEWPLDDMVTAKNFQKRLADYGIVDYINPSLIEEGRDAYAVVSKQYGIYRDALEKRIRKAKLKQLEEAEGKATSKKEKKEREKEVVMEIEAELPPQPPAYEEYKVEAGKEDVAVEMEAELSPGGAGMPWELKRKLDEDIEEKEKEEIRNSLDESEKEPKKTGHEFEKSGYKKGKIKKETAAAIEDPLGIGDVLREEQKEHAKKIGAKPKAKKKKIGFFERLSAGLFGKK